MRPPGGGNGAGDCTLVLVSRQLLPSHYSKRGMILVHAVARGTAQLWLLERGCCPADGRLMVPDHTTRSGVKQQACATTEQQHSNKTPRKQWRHAHNSAAALRLARPPRPATCLQSPGSLARFNCADPALAPPRPCWLPRAAAAAVFANKMRCTDTEIALEVSERRWPAACCPAAGG